MRRRIPLSADGTTLVELAVGLVIVGLLVGIAAPSVVSGIRNAELRSCRSNQEQIREFSTLLQAQEALSAGELNVDDLVAEGLLRYEAARCPADRTTRETAYRVRTLPNGTLSVECLVDAAHSIQSGSEPPKSRGGRLPRWLKDLLD